jgi:PAS domain S-box-containing protein
MANYWQRRKSSLARHSVEVIGFDVMANLPTRQLSDRERQLLELARQGFTDQAIAKELEISVPTVATYWGRIRIKMGPLSRPELVAHYVQAESAVRMEALHAENESLRRRLTPAIEEGSRAAPSFDSILELIRKAPDAVLIVNRGGEILLGNEAAAALFGCPMEDFSKLRVGSFIPAEVHEAHRAHRERFFETGVRSRMGDHDGVQARRLDGTRVRITAAVSMAETQQGPIAIVFAREAEAFHG